MYLYIIKQAIMETTKTQSQEIQTVKMILLAANGINTMQRHSSSVSLAVDYLNRIDAANKVANNAFIQSVVDQAVKGRISEKQAWCVAKWAVENQIEL